MEYFIIIQFNTLEVVTEYAKHKREKIEISYLTKKLNEYYPPFTHVNFLLPQVKGKCDPNDCKAWMKVIITHSKTNKGVRLESVSTPTRGQYHMFLKCTAEDIETIRMVITGILEHQESTYCSITIPNVLLSYSLYKTAPKCLRPKLLPLPHFQQNGWHCSELSTFLLQAGGLVSRYIYPFFVTPTELFLLCYHNPRHVKTPNFKTVFTATGLDGWEAHHTKLVKPYEITPDSCIAVEYFRSYHETTNDEVSA